MTLATLVVSGWLYVQAPKGFFPVEDTGFLVGSTESAPDTSVTAMAERQLKVVEIVKNDPAIAYLSSAVGFGGIVNQGRIFMALKPKAERGDQMAVVARLRKATSVVPGITFVMMPIQNFNLNAGRITRAMYQYTMQSSDLEALYGKAPDMLARARDLPGLRDVTSDLQISNPTATVDIDREKAAAYGVTTDQIRAALYNAFGTKQISTIYTQASDYQVIIEASRDFQNDPEALNASSSARKTPAGARAARWPPARAALFRWTSSSPSGARWGR